MTARTTTRNINKSLNCSSLDLTHRKCPGCYFPKLGNSSSCAPKSPIYTTEHSTLIRVAGSTRTPSQTEREKCPPIALRVCGSIHLPDAWEFSLGTANSVYYLRRKLPSRRRRSIFSGGHADIFPASHGNTFSATKNPSDDAMAGWVARPNAPTLKPLRSRLPLGSLAQFLWPSSIRLDNAGMTEWSKYSDGGASVSLNFKRATHANGVKRPRKNVEAGFGFGLQTPEGDGLPSVGAVIRFNTVQSASRLSHDVSRRSIIRT